MALPIGGFMPIPLAMMIPFMATQSMVMGDAFGQAFQYGKRKISAMSNEEFNATTMEQLASQMFKAYQNIIPDLEESIKQSRGLQSLIVTELLRLPVSIFQDVTGSSGNAESIRTPSTPANQQPIGTETPQGVIVGYINGVPQYGKIPSTSSRRNSQETKDEQTIRTHYQTAIQNVADLTGRKNNRPAYNNNPIKVSQRRTYDAVTASLQTRVNMDGKTTANLITNFIKKYKRTPNYQ